MALTETQAKRAGRKLAKEIFEQLGATANFNLDDLRAAIDSFETAMSATTNQVQSAHPGVTLQNALIANLPEPFKTTSTGPQKAIALACWAFEKAGLIED